MRSRRLALIALLAVVPTACSSDGSSDGGGGGTIRSLLGTMPSSALAGDRSFVLLTMADYDVVSELAGLERPGADAPRERRIEWYSTLIGREDDASVAALFPRFVQAFGPLQLEDEYGWGLEQVESYVEAEAEDTFTSLRTDGVTADDLDAAQDAEDDDLWSTGTTRELYTALDDDGIAIGRDVDVIDDWRSGTDTLADDGELVALAEQLDDADAYAAMMWPEALAPKGDQAELPEFGSMAIGLAVDDGDPTGIIVYRFGSDDDADDARDDVEDVLTNTGSGGSRVADIMSGIEVDVDGRDVVVTGDVSGQVGALWGLIEYLDPAILSG